MLESSSREKPRACAVCVIGTRVAWARAVLRDRDRLIDSFCIEVGCSCHWERVGAALMLLSRKGDGGVTN